METISGILLHTFTGIRIFSSCFLQFLFSKECFARFFLIPESGERRFSRIYVLFVESCEFFLLFLGCLLLLLFGGGGGEGTFFMQFSLGCAVSCVCVCHQAPIMKHCPMFPPGALRLTRDVVMILGACLCWPQSGNVSLAHNVSFENQH